MKLPEWALSVLISPHSRTSLTFDGNCLTTPDQSYEYQFQDSLVYFAEDQDIRNRDVSPQLDPKLELLLITQVRFRRILKQFVSTLPGDSIVVDAGSDDSEMKEFYGERRYLAMDLSVSALKRAIALNRITFGIIANVKNLPLRKESVDAIISTNILVHFKDEPLANALDLIASSVKNGGQVLLTLQGARYCLIENAFPTENWTVEKLFQYESDCDQFWRQTVRRVFSFCVSPRGNKHMFSQCFLEIYHLLTKAVSWGGIRLKTSETLDPHKCFAISMRKK